MMFCRLRASPWGQHVLQSIPNLWWFSAGEHNSEASLGNTEEVLIKYLFPLCVCKLNCRFFKTEKDLWDHLFSIFVLQMGSGIHTSVSGTDSSSCWSVPLLHLVQMVFPQGPSQHWSVAEFSDSWMVQFFKKFLLFYYSYVHTMLGLFLPPAPTPSLTTHSTLSPPTPRYPAETILPLFLILL
jgi:hypothetical protein